MKSDIIIINEGASKKCVVILALLASLCVLGVIVVAAVFVMNSKKDTEDTELEKCQKEVEQLRSDVVAQNSEIKNQDEEIKHLDINIADLTEKKMLYKRVLENCAAKRDTQKTEIDFLTKKNNYLLIGTGAVAVLGLGGTGLAAYEEYLDYSLTSQIEAYQNLIKEQDRNITALETNITLSKNRKQELIDKITLLQVEISNVNEEIEKLKEANDNLKQVIEALEEEYKKLYNSYTKLVEYHLISMIGAGITTLLALGEGIWIFFANQANFLLSQELTTITAKYEHFNQYFDNTRLWTAQDYLNHYLGKDIRWTLLYDSDKNTWSKAQIKQSIVGKANTMTMITTTKNWTISVVLQKPWVEDGFVHDEKAFILSLNRGWESLCDPLDTTHEKCKKAARIGSSNDVLLEFGEGELVLYANKSASSVYGKTFNNFDSSKKIPPTEFYAGESPFTISSIQILQFYVSTA